jgi:hypothetical protein
MNIFFLDTDEFQFPEGQRSLIIKTAGLAEKEIRELLPSLASHLNLTVISSKHVIPETGEAATTPNASWIQLSINPWDERGVEKIVEAQLRSTLFHEAHHAARVAKQPWGNDLVTNAIAEGLATVFERDFTGSRPLWGDYDKDLAADWSKELLAADSETANHDHYFFYHPDGRRWIAYRVGTYIVDQAIARNTDITSASLVDEPADKILDLAGLKRV